MGCSLNHGKNWTRILNITEKYWTLLYKILNPGFKILWPEILNPSLIFIWFNILAAGADVDIMAAKYYPTLYLFSIFTGEGSHNMTTDLLTSDFYLLYERRFKTSWMRNIDNPLPPPIFSPTCTFKLHLR